MKPSERIKELLNQVIIDYGYKDANAVHAWIEAIMQYLDEQALK